VDGGERAVLDHALEHLERVVPDDAQVLQALRLDAVEQAAHAWPVHLDRHEIGVRLRGGNRGGGLAHARTDLEHERRVARGAKRRIGERNAVLREQRVQRPLLRGADAPLAQDEAADRAIQAALDEIVPSLGEEGVAE